MPRPLENFSLSQLLEELKNRYDCFALATLHRQAPFDETDEEEVFRVYFCRSPHTALGLIRRADHLLLSDEAERIPDDDEDEDELEPST